MGEEIITMNCFNHRDKPAIGLCTSCGKALCENCLVEIPNGLACKGSCEDRANMIARMIDTNAQTLKTATQSLNVTCNRVRTTAILSVLMGIGCLVLAVWAYFVTSSLVAGLVGILSVYSLLSGISSLSRKEQYPLIEEKRTE